MERLMKFAKTPRAFHVLSFLVAGLFAAGCDATDSPQKDSGQLDGNDDPDVIAARDSGQDSDVNESMPRCISYYDESLIDQAPNAARWCREGAVMTWKSADWPSPIELFYHCEGEPSDPAIYLQHGWPTSSFDFQELSAALSSDYYVCALDTPGYGFSDKPDGYPYSILEDGEIVQTFIEDIMEADEVLLLTHDKGDSVGLELLHRYVNGSADFVLTRFIILNGSVRLDQAQISTFQTALLDLESGPGIVDQITGDSLASLLGVSVYSPPLTDTEVADLASVFDFDNGTAVLHQTIQYLAERSIYENDRWLKALADSIVPTTLIWGELDPVAVPAVADYVWNEVLSTRPAPAEYWRVPCGNHYIQNDRTQDVLAIVRNEELPSHRDGQCEESRLYRSTDYPMLITYIRPQ